MSEENKGRAKRQNQQQEVPTQTPAGPRSESDPQLSHRDAITADFGATTNPEAREKGYDGYVWEENKAQYTQQEVVNNDQSGPLKSVDDDWDPMDHHFIRADKLDESAK